MTTSNSHNVPPIREKNHADSLTDLPGTIGLIVDKGLLILVCVAMTLIGAAAFIHWSTPKYEATATLEVRQQGQKIFKDNEVQSMDAKTVEILNTIVQKLENPALLERVLATNNLLLPEGVSITNSSGVLTRKKMIARFTRDVKVTLRRNTFLIDVVVRSPDPKLAAQLANSIVENYLEQEALVEQTAAELAVGPLQQEANRLRNNLEASEQALQDYRKQVGSVSLDQTQDILTPDMQNLNHLLSGNAANLVQARGTYEDSLKMGTNIDELLAYPQIATDPKVLQITTAIAQQEDDFVQIQQRYREKHPKYILEQTSLEGLRNQLAKTVLEIRSRWQETQRINYENFLTAQQGLEGELTNAENKVLQLGDNSVRFNVLSRKVESDRALYDAVITQVGEMAVSAQVMPEKIRVITSASTPDGPVSPKKLLIYALAIFGGLAIGLGLSFALHSLDGSFQSVDDLEQHLTLPVLVAIPRLKTQTDDAKPLILHGEKSMGVEIFRTLRTSMSMLNRGRNGSEKRTFLFASSLPNEGKSFVAINHAASLAQQGLRTLVIDADLREPVVEKIFSGAKGQLPGVTDYFINGAKIEDLFVPCKDIPHLSWLAAGIPVSDPSELLAQIDFRKLLYEGLLHFDRIVIDTAPLLPVSDTLVLVDKVDAVILVVQGRKTPRVAVDRSVRLLNQAESKIIGLVLNLLPDTVLNNYHYSYSYGDNYGNHKSNIKRSAVEKELSDISD